MAVAVGRTKARGDAIITKDGVLGEVIPERPDERAERNRRLHDGWNWKEKPMFLFAVLLSYLVPFGFFSITEEPESSSCLTAPEFGMPAGTNA